RFFFSSRRRHTRSKRDWSSDVCSSDLTSIALIRQPVGQDAGFIERADGDRRHLAKLAGIGKDITQIGVLHRQRFDGGFLGVRSRSEERRVGQEWRGAGGSECGGKDGE